MIFCLEKDEGNSIGEEFKQFESNQFLDEVHDDNVNLLWPIDHGLNVLEKGILLDL